MWVECVQSQAGHLPAHCSCSEGGPSSGSLWHWESDCQTVSWMVRLGSFLNIYYKFPHLSLFYKWKPHILFIHFSAVTPYSELWLLPVLVTFSNFSIFWINLCCEKPPSYGTTTFWRAGFILHNTAKLCLGTGICQDLQILAHPTQDTGLLGAKQGGEGL